MVINYVLTKFKTSEIDKIDEAINQGIVKVAQRIAAQVGQPTAQIFHEMKDRDDESSEVT